MAIKFEFYESPNTIGTRKKRYHARVVNWQRINTDYLAREIQYGSSLTVADIKATIISLSEKLAYYLKDGARVHIEGIGYFHISLTCPETRTPSSTRANKVKFKSVTFRADKYLKHQLSDVKTERSKYKPSPCRQSADRPACPASAQREKNRCRCKSQTSSAGQSRVK